MDVLAKAAGLADRLPEPTGMRYLGGDRLGCNGWIVGSGDRPAEHEYIGAVSDGLGWCCYSALVVSWDAGRANARNDRNDVRRYASDHAKVRRGADDAWAAGS